MPSKSLLERTTIADLGEIVSIKINSGKVNHIPLTQSDFYIAASNGDIVKSEVASGEVFGSIIARSKHSNVVSLVRTFEGNVSRVKTPVYSGEVTRPASDTRIYENYYNYIVEVEHIPIK